MSENIQKVRGFNVSALKYLACLFMLIDHIGLFLFPELMSLRIIGRLAFPIFAFMIANGYLHTSNPTRYFLRLALLGIAFQWFFAMIMESWLLNIFITLALGLAAIWVADILNKKIANHCLAQVCGIIDAIVIGVIAELINVDYGWYGIALIFTAWFFYNKFALISLSWMIITIALIWPLGTDVITVQIFALFALIFIKAYNGKPGKSNRWFFYIFYPLHLAILYMLSLWLV